MRRMASDLLLYVGAARAARLLDIGRLEFLRLVELGALPPPLLIGAHKRWSVDQLRAIGSGESAMENPIKW